MNSVNTVTLIGHLCSDPKKVDSDVIGAKLVLATNDSYFSKTDQVKKTQSEFHYLKCWKNDADFALKYLKKGDYIYAEGKIHYHTYTTDDGKTGRNMEIICRKVMKLNKNQKAPKQVTEE